MKVALPPWIRKFKLATLGGVIILGCVMAFLLRFSRAGELETELASARDEVFRMRRNLENSENLASQLETIEALAARVEDRTVVPADAAVNKAYFYQFEKPELQIDSVEQSTPGESKAKDPWKLKDFGTVDFRITATGSFREVLRLAYRLRGGPKLVRVTELALLPDRGGGRESRRIEIRLEALAAEAEPGGKSDED